MRLSEPMRLPGQPGEVINRGEPVEFTWNGRPVPRLRGGHHHLRAGRRRGAGVLPEPEIPPPARPAHRLLPRPRLHGPGGGRAERPRRPPAGDRRPGRHLAEHLALAAAGREGGEPARRALPHRRLLLQDLHAPALLVACLRERAPEVRQRRDGVTRHRAHPPGEAPRPPRRPHRRRRPGGDGRGRQRRPGGRVRPAGRRGTRPRRASALGRRGRPGGAGRTGRPARRRARRGGADRRGGARALRRKLARDPRAAPRRRGSRAPHPGPRQDARGRAGTDRAALRVRGQRPARGHALHRRAQADQPVRGQAGTAGGGADRQPRRRRGHRRPQAGRRRGGPGGGRAARR